MPQRSLFTFLIFTGATLAPIAERRKLMCFDAFGSEKPSMTIKDARVRSRQMAEDVYYKMWRLLAVNQEDKQDERSPLIELDKDHTIRDLQSAFLTSLARHFAFVSGETLTDEDIIQINDDDDDFSPLGQQPLPNEY
jgi:hypothetical protein